MARDEAGHDFIPQRDVDASVAVRHAGSAGHGQVALCLAVVLRPGGPGAQRHGPGRVSGHRCKGSHSCFTMSMIR